MPMRDHRKLIAFQLADALALKVYRSTRDFPKEETYGLAIQLRRSIVSVASNIAEGSARNGEADFFRFLDIAQGSAREASYQLSLAHRLGYLPDGELENEAEDVCRTLGALIRALRSPAPQDSVPRTQA